MNDCIIVRVVCDYYMNDCIIVRVVCDYYMNDNHNIFTVTQITLASGYLRVHVSHALCALQLTEGLLGRNVLHSLHVHSCSSMLKCSPTYVLSYLLMRL